jgi:hypothetical protein
MHTGRLVGGSIKVLDTAKVEAEQYGGWRLKVDKRPYEDGYRNSRGASRVGNRSNESLDRGRSRYRARFPSEKDCHDEWICLPMVYQNPINGGGRAWKGVCTTMELQSCRIDIGRMFTELLLASAGPETE